MTWTQFPVTLAGVRYLANVAHGTVSRLVRERAPRVPSTAQDSQRLQRAELKRRRKRQARLDRLVLR